MTYQYVSIFNTSVSSKNICIHIILRCSHHILVHIMHKCDLPKLSLSALPELAPQSGRVDKILRKVKRWFLVSTMHHSAKLVFRSTNSIYLERKRHLSQSKWFIIHPYSPMSVVIQITMVINWIICFVLEPILDAFFDLKAREKSYMSYVIEVTTNVHRIFILVSFLRGYVVYKTTEVVLSPKLIAIQYAKTYLIIDIIGVLPVHRVVYLLGGSVI